MSASKSIDHTSFSDLTGYVTSVFNFYHYEMKDIFSDYPLYFVEYYEKDKYECVIEIRFDKQQASLACFYNKEKRCDTAYLFMNNYFDVVDYIEYINKKYAYDYLGSRWLMPNCFMSVKRTEKITCFMFFR